MSNWTHVFGTQYPSINLSWLDDQFNQISSTATATVSFAGANILGYTWAGISVAGTVAAKLNQVVSVKDPPFNAVGDGVADDTSAINAASSAAGTGTVLFPAGNYLVTSALTIPTGQKWQGQGGQRTTQITKGFNGDLITMGDFTSISDINLECVGASFSGKGIYVSTGFSQYITRVRVANSQGQCLDFAADVGGGANVISFEGTTTAPTSVSAIRLGADTTAVPRFFYGIWLSGGLFEFTAGSSSGNGGSLTNFYIRNFLISSGTTTTGMGLFKIENGRVASISDTTTFRGGDCQFTNVSFSGPVALTNCQGFLFSSCIFGAGISEDSTCNSNSFDYGTTYTPTWNQPSGTQPSLGNGTLSAFYLRTGRLCKVVISLTIGSTTTTGNNATAYQFSLPFISTTTQDQKPTAARVNTALGTDYTVWGEVAANGSILIFGYGGGAVRDGTPTAWATGDKIEAEVTYQTI